MLLTSGRFSYWDILQRFLFHYLVSSCSCLLQVDHEISPIFCSPRDLAWLSSTNQCHQHLRLTTRSLQSLYTNRTRLSQSPFMERWPGLWVTDLSNNNSDIFCLIIDNWTVVLSWLISIYRRITTVCIRFYLSTLIHSQNIQTSSKDNE